MTRIDITVIDRARQNRAYPCFVPTGLLAVIAGVVGGVPMDTGTTGGVGLLVLVPLTLLTLVFLPRGIYLSIRLRKVAILIVLSVSTVLWIVAMLAEIGPAKLRTVVSVIYGGLVMILIATWFVRGRHADRD